MAAKNLRFNDGRVDRQGRFWAGSMVEGKGAAHRQSSTAFAERRQKFV